MTYDHSVIFNIAFSDSRFDPVISFNACGGCLPAATQGGVAIFVGSRFRSSNLRARRSQPDSLGIENLQMINPEKQIKTRFSTEISAQKRLVRAGNQ
jgi:hypothetical protein